jgi:hypothetical protein
MLKFADAKKGSVPAHPIIRRQKGGTCYAYSTSTVIYFALLRVVNRKGGVPPLDEICQEIVARFSNDGGRGWEVLGYMCPWYRLQYEAVFAPGLAPASEPLSLKFEFFVCSHSRHVSRSTFLGKGGINPQKQRRFELPSGITFDSYEWTVWQDKWIVVFLIS